MERNSTQTHITGHFIDGPFQAINCTGIELTPKIHENTQNANSKIYRLIIVKKKHASRHTQKPEPELSSLNQQPCTTLHVPSRELLKDNMRRYRSRIAMSSHIRCCSSVGVGDMHVRSINYTSEDTKQILSCQIRINER